jgi:hypothetical protein
MYLPPGFMVLRGVEQALKGLMQKRAAATEKHELAAMTPGFALHRRWQRPHYFQRRRWFQVLFQLVEELHRPRKGLGFRPQDGHVSVGRKSSQAPLLEGSERKPVIVAGGEGGHRGMFGMMGLQNHFTRTAGPTGTSGHLQYDLGHVFRSAEVGTEESCIGIHHGHQRHAGEVMSLG